ncbi:hypothetical protein GXW83_25425 [Streptacidiphilus sp. PB12-B1b]|uniref:hypothetical protein n=1 Tax=Streptacidiphilus sp. PB12-B1b TaxID=2705012 RepID=UPI0015FE3DEC|nr:hypothetical protein [Streptacidiphilus sp. PB12-B1b]QMU78550.1 hypothetical protein GXW83_25425 [Streptacidiphilus sp. PB12-B1b]
MSVLAWLLIAPLGLLLILGLAWFEDTVLRPPASPADQVLQRQTETVAPARRGRATGRSNPVAQISQAAKAAQAAQAGKVAQVAQVAQGTAELLSLVRLQPRRTAERPGAGGRDSAA